MSDVTTMIRALDQDESPRSGWVMFGGVIDTPRQAFVVGVGWCREDGTRVSGWDGHRYFAFRPHLLDRWRLRRAMRRWIRRRDDRARRETDH